MIGHTRGKKSPPSWLLDLCSVQHLRKLIGCLKSSGDMGIKLDWPEHGAGKWKKGTKAFWLLEGFTDADWCGNKSSRRSASCSVLCVNGCFVFASSRSQRVISLSSAASELHSMISGTCDSLFVKNCLEFLLQVQIEHHQFTDNSAARQLISKGDFQAGGGAHTPPLCKAVVASGFGAFR